MTLTPPSPPKWTQRNWAKKLIHVNRDLHVNPSFLGHILISCAIILLALGSYVWALRSIFHHADQWRICQQLTPPSPIDAPPTQTPTQEFPDLAQVIKNINSLNNTGGDAVLNTQKERLVSQLQQLDQAQRSACTIGIFFFAHRNATYTIATATGIATLAALAFVSKRGWERSNNAVINVGMTSGFILFSTWTFSQLYGQGINYESQRIKQSLATDLMNTVATAAANGKSYGFPNSPIEGKDVFWDLKTAAGMGLMTKALDKELKVLTTLDFGVDATFAQNAAIRIGLMFSPEEKAPSGSSKGKPNQP